MPKYSSRMICASCFHHLRCWPCALVVQVSFCYHRAIQFLLQLFQATSSQFYGVQDQEMSDVPDPLLGCDTDVVGPDATLNNNNMDIDMDVDAAGEITHSPRRSVSPQSPASALSGLLSMIEYATMPVLIDIAKRHNVLLPLRTKRETLRDLVVSHLSSGECAESEAESCMQLVSTFHNQSDVSYVLTKYNFQIQILSSITNLVRSRPLQRILSCLHVSFEPLPECQRILREDLIWFLLSSVHCTPGPFPQ